MTPPPHPQKEYIINEEMVQCIEAWTQKYPTVSKDIADAIRSRPASHSSPAAAPVRCCETCENVPCKVRDKVPCIHSNPCEENGCTDIENCDEICDHSRIFSPLQMEAAKQQAAAKERERVLDALEKKIRADMLPKSQQWEMGMYIQYEKVLSMIKSLRGEQPPQEPQ